MTSVVPQGSKSPRMQGLTREMAFSSKMAPGLHAASQGIYGTLGRKGSRRPMSVNFGAIMKGMKGSADAAREELASQEEGAEEAPTFSEELHPWAARVVSSKKSSREAKLKGSSRAQVPFRFLAAEEAAASLEMGAHSRMNWLEFEELNSSFIDWDVNHLEELAREAERLLGARPQQDCLISDAHMPTSADELDWMNDIGSAVNEAEHSKGISIPVPKSLNLEGMNSSPASPALKRVQQAEKKARRGSWREKGRSGEGMSASPDLDTLKLNPLSPKPRNSVADATSPPSTPKGTRRKSKFGTLGRSANIGSPRLSLLAAGGSPEEDGGSSSKRSARGSSSLGASLGSMDPFVPPDSEPRGLSSKLKALKEGARRKMSRNSVNLKLRSRGALAGSNSPFVQRKSTDSPRTKKSSSPAVLETEELQLPDTIVLGAETSYKHSPRMDAFEVVPVSIREEDNELESETTPPPLHLSESLSDLKVDAQTMSNLNSLFASQDLPMVPEEEEDVEEQEGEKQGGTTHRKKKKRKKKKKPPDDGDGEKAVEVPIRREPQPRKRRPKKTRSKSAIVSGSPTFMQEESQRDSKPEPEPSGDLDEEIWEDWM